MINYAASTLEDRRALAQTARQRDSVRLLNALGLLGKHVYGGTVAPEVVEARRERNRRARRARRVHRLARR